MPRKTPQIKVVSFKVEAELARLLNGLPNKSAFIRKAIAAQLGTACPLCQGQGTVTRDVHEHFLTLAHDSRLQPCAACGGELLLPDDPGTLQPEDGARLEQFFRGGPLYCDGCYRTAPLCGECGWHIEGDKIDDHRRVAHPAEGGPDPG